MGKLVENRSLAGKMFRGLVRSESFKLLRLD